MMPGPQVPERERHHVSAGHGLPVHCTETNTGMVPLVDSDAGGFVGAFDESCVGAFVGPFFGAFVIRTISDSSMDK